MIWSTYPAFFIPPPLKFHDKGVQSNILWLNLNKINEVSILQSAHKQGNLSFHYHAPVSKRRYPCTQTASAVQKYISPVCSSFVLVIESDMHLESESEKRAKNVDFHTAKNIKLQHFFANFRIRIDWPPTYLL